MRFNMDEHIKVVQSHAGENWGVAANAGAEIDTYGYGEALIIVNAGTVGSSGTLDVTVTECASSGGSFTAITSAAFTQIVAANDDTVYVARLKLQGTNPARLRYIKVLATVAVAACDVGIVVLLSKVGSLPISQANTVAFSL